MINHKHNKKGNSQQKKVANKYKSTVPKDLQETLPSRNDDFERRRQQLMDETQNFMYQQSSKFSSVSRNLAFGIIGTIWVITYTEKKLCIPNCWLVACIFFLILFHVCDVLHYFLDSMSYHKESYKLDEYVSNEDIDQKHESNMNEINRRSHRFIIIKFVFLIMASFCFLVGMCVFAYQKV